VSDVLPATREEIAVCREAAKAGVHFRELLPMSPNWLLALLARLDAVEQALAEAVREVREHNLRPMYATDDAALCRWEALLETPR
jgi:hypothetical protein